MAKKNTQLRKERVIRINELLTKTHPDAKVTLKFSSPIEMLISTILSAQCTDERVNLITSDLF